MTWFVTFGEGQPLAGCYAVVRDVSDSEEAHRKVCGVYRYKWANLYDDSQFDQAIGWWKLQEVPFGLPNEYPNALEFWRRLAKERKVP